jgi:rhamnosyltransferase
MSSPSKSNTVAIIITFNPGEKFIDLIKSLYASVDVILVVDNCSKSKSIINKALKLYRFNLINNNANLGIAAALNQGMRYAKSNNFEWAATFDQDSVIVGDYLGSLSEVYLNHNIVGSGAIGFICPALLLNKERKKWVQKDPITSGSLISLRAINDIGLFREQFFIDHVDTDFSIRCRLKKYHILVSNIPTLYHRLGEAELKFIFGFPVHPSNHPPIRWYYHSRNMCFLVRLYLYISPIIVSRAIWNFTKIFFKMVIFEDSKLNKIKYMLVGIWDGINQSIQCPDMN